MRFLRWAPSRVKRRLPFSSQSKLAGASFKKISLMALQPASERVRTASSLHKWAVAICTSSNKSCMTKLGSYTMPPWAKSLFASDKGPQHNIMVCRPFLAAWCAYTQPATPAPITKQSVFIVFIYILYIIRRIYSQKQLAFLFLFYYYICPCFASVCEI